MKQTLPERIAWLEATLKEMSTPEYYGSWCSGYLRKHYENELKKLKNEAKAKAAR